MRMWDDRTAPIGYLITFRAHRTWLHGDERTSIDRFMNKYGGPRIPHRPEREAYNKTLSKIEPVYLNATRRKAIGVAIDEVCQHRGWELKAKNVRTNHVHVVVLTGDRKPGLVLNAFKAYSTRKMREAGCWESARSPWADKGSNRWLWTDDSVWYACNYVINGQGEDLTEFDRLCAERTHPLTQVVLPKYE